MLCACEFLSGSIPYFEVGRPGSPLIVLSGGQAFMRKPDRERLRRDAARLKRLLPKGCGFTLFGYGPRHYAEGGLDGLADSFAGILGCRSGPVQLVGISYGGLVAVRLAARHPRLVSDLILVSSAATFSGEAVRRVRRQIELASQRRYAELLSEFGGSFRRPWYNWLLRVRLVLRRARLADEMNAPDEIAAYLRAGEAEGSVIPGWLSRIAARTLVIGGTNDRFFGRTMLETANAIEDARVCLLPSETHLAPLERAAAFRHEIAVFLAGSECDKSGRGRCRPAMHSPKEQEISMSELPKFRKPSLDIRGYDPKLDLDRCMDIWRAASEAGHPFLGAAALDSDARIVREHYMPAADILVAETEGNVSGFIALLGSFIGGLFVDPLQHGQGIGRALTLEARRRHPTLEVEVYEANAGAREFYARLGFTEAGRREIDDQGRHWPLVALRLSDRVDSGAQELRRGRSVP